MTAHWLLLGPSSLPPGDDWLGPDEKRALSRYTVPKRRAEWRHGRFTAKQALAPSLGIARLDRIQLVAASDGAPEAFVDGAATGLSVSISHRNGAAACVWSRDLVVGCDLEVVEPRSERFIEDFFTDRERAAVARMTDLARQLQVALVWSAKESALKVVRAGLRRDTRRVEVEVAEPQASGEEWRRLHATLHPEALRLSGWWHQARNMVLTVVCASEQEIARGHEPTA